MSGETEEHESGWTTDTLKYHVDQQFKSLHEAIVALRRENDDRDRLLVQIMDERHKSQTDSMETALRTADRAVLAALEAAEKAVAKAEASNEKRFESVNEFRGQLADQATRFVTRAEIDAVQIRNAERVSELQDRMNRSEGQHKGSASAVGIGLAIVTVVISVVIVFVNVILAQ